jgi:hypothetical protein
MARKPVIVSDVQGGEVVLSLTRVEAQVLLVAADRGLKVIEALDLLRNTATMEGAIRKHKAAT